MSEMEEMEGRAFDKVSRTGTPQSGSARGDPRARGSRAGALRIPVGSWAETRKFRAGGLAGVGFDVGFLFLAWLVR